MLSKHARGARPLGGRQRGTGVRLAMLVAALVLVLGSCGLADPVTKSRTDSVRGAAWPGADGDEVTLGSVAVVHTGTPSPTATPSPFRGAFEPPAGVEDADGTDGEATGPGSDRTHWPGPTPDEPYEELGHSPEPEPDPCDAVGVLPDECDPEPEPTPCDDSADGCDPTGCEQDGDGCDPPDCDGGPTSEPTEPPEPSQPPGSTQSPGSTQTADPTQTPGASQSPEPTQTPDPTEPPDDEPGC